FALSFSLTVSLSLHDALPIYGYFLDKLEPIPSVGSVLVLMLPLLVWLTPDLRIKKSLLKCNWTIRKRLPRCKMRLKKRLLAFSRSEERFSRNAETDIVCRLLLEKKKEQER